MSFVSPDHAKIENLERSVFLPLSRLQGYWWDVESAVSFLTTASREPSCSGETSAPSTEPQSITGSLLAILDALDRGEPAVSGWRVVWLDDDERDAFRIIKDG